LPILRAHRCIAPEGDVRHALGEGLDAAGELVAGLVGVDRGDDRAHWRQAGKDPAEQLELRAAGRAGSAQVPGGLAAVGVELVVAERVDGALGDDERSIVPTRDALPGRLGSSSREPRKADVLGLEAGDGAGVVAVHEERVATRVVGPRAREAEIPQGLPAKASRMEVGARRGDACRGERLRRQCPVSRWPRLYVVDQRPLGAEPLP
jgi:hypothetical protein